MRSNRIESAIFPLFRGGPVFRRTGRCSGGRAGVPAGGPVFRRAVFPPGADQKNEISSPAVISRNLTGLLNYE